MQSGDIAERTFRVEPSDFALIIVSYLYRQEGLLSACQRVRKSSDLTWAETEPDRSNEIEALIFEDKVSDRHRMRLNRLVTATPRHGLSAYWHGLKLQEWRCSSRRQACHSYSLRSSERVFKSPARVQLSFFFISQSNTLAQVLPIQHTRVPVPFSAQDVYPVRSSQRCFSYQAV